MSYNTRSIERYKSHKLHSNTNMEPETGLSIDYCSPKVALSSFHVRFPERNRRAIAQTPLATCYEVGKMLEIVLNDRFVGGARWPPPRFFY